MLYSRFRGPGANRCLVLMLATTLGLVACGGGGGSDGSGPTNTDTTSDAPSGDTDISASSLQGTWSGSIEPYGSDAGKFKTLSVTFDAAGDISQVDLDGATLNGVTGTRQGKPTDSSQIFEYNLDGDTLFLWVNSDVSHAGIVFEDGSMGVIEKGASDPAGYGTADAVVGNWTGASVFLIEDNGLTEDGFDDVTASYADNGGTLESTDLSLTDPDGENQDCLNLTHTLMGYDGSYGVHDTADVTGGDGDCPGSDVVPADVYVSPDANFMMFLAGCEAGDDGTGVLDECSVAVLNRQTP